MDLEWEHILLTITWYLYGEIMTWRVDQYKPIRIRVKSGKVHIARKWVTAGIYTYKADALKMYDYVKRTGDPARMTNYKYMPKYLF